MNGEHTSARGIKWGWQCPSNIILFGFMAAGKTTVGRELSSLYGFELIETDDLIARACGKSIPEIFKESGEVLFRTVETEVIKSLQGQRGLVLSTGGGVIENPDNLVSLSGDGIPFTLDAPFDVLWERVVADSIVRPLAKSREHMKKLYTRRKPFYRSIANLVDTDGIAISEIAVTIYEKFLLLGGLAP